MADALALRSREEIAGDIIRVIAINSDINDVAANSTLANLVEGISSVEFQIQMSVLKILEASNIESLTGSNLDKKAVSLGLPNTIGGQGRIPSNQAGGPVTISSAFQKISSKPYAGKPAPFAGTRTLYLENASSFPATGSVYLGRGTVDRFEGPIPYSAVTNNGSFWTVTLSVPLTKSHPYTDLVVVAQGGDRTVQAGLVVQQPPNSNSPAVVYTTLTSLTIPDGESSGTVQVTCTQFGTVGNALAGAINQFGTIPFPGATVSNPSTFVNGANSESDESLRLRIKNFPSTLSRGTATAILAALQGARDPVTGRSILSSTIIEPLNPGESAKVYIDDGTGLEPTFAGQAYELLLNSASGQEKKFSTAQIPLTMAVAIGSATGPFAISVDDVLTVVVDGVAESYSPIASNYANLNSASVYEIVRDFNSQANLLGWRTIGGGTGLAAFDLSGTSETLVVDAGRLQALFGLPTATLRPIFLYKNSKLLSFQGHTATLSTTAFPWSLVSGDLNENIVVVDGVPQTVTITDSDFAIYTSNIATATLTQWAAVLAKKIAGVSFGVLGSRLVWQTYQDLSPTGSLQILTTRADGSLATWIGPSKMWDSAQVLSDVGALKDFNLNRFLGQVELIDKPNPGDKIEIGSRTTRGHIDSVVSSNGLFTLNQITPGTGTSKLIVAFDGEFAPRNVFVAPALALTPSFPDATNAYNILRLTSNDTGVFAETQVGDWTWIQPDTTQVTWGSSVQGFYLVKAAGANGKAVNTVYSNLAASAVAYTSLAAQTRTASATIIVTKTAHGLATGTLITVTTSTSIGGITAGNLNETSTPITIIDKDHFSYQANAAATSDSNGTLDTVGHNVVTVTQASHGFKSGAAITVTTASAIGGISGANLSVTQVPITVINANTYTFYAASAATATGSGTLATVTYLADAWIEIEVSSVQRSDWNTLVGTPQTFTTGMFSAFGCSVIPQLVDFGSLGTSTADQVVAAINSQISGGTVVKLNPQTVSIRSNDYLTTGTVGVLAVIGNAKNIFPTPAVSASFQAHVGSSTSGDIMGGFPVVTGIVNQTANSAGYGSRAYLKVDREITEVLDTAANPTIQAYPNESDYPVGFQHLWLTGRNMGLGARLYNTAATSPFAGFMRGEPMILPMQTSDSRQTSTVGSLNRYAQLGLRLTDTPITENDRLVVVMDNNPVDETVSVPFFKRAQIQDIDALAGAGKGTVIAFRLQDPDDLDPTNFNLPRPFFDTQSVYRTFDFNDFKILTLSVGLYKDSTGQTMPARGSLTAIAAGTGSIQPGDTFTLNDGINAAKTFEFTTTTPSGGHVGIVYTPGAMAVGSLTAIAQAASGFQDGDTITLNDGTNVPTVFEFDSNGSTIIGNIPITFVAAVRPTGSLTATFADPATGIKSGDTFTISDGVTAKIFEFTTTTPAGGHIAVTITATMTDTNVKAAMLSAINSVGGGWSVTAFSGSGDLISLQNTNFGTAGNVTITQSMANSGVTLLPTGMSGGVDYATAAAIKSAIISAINGVGAGLAITAASGSGNLINLTNDANGTAGNQAITQSISNGASFTPTGMSGGISDPNAFVIKGLMLAAIQSQSGSLFITATAGAGNTINLVDTMAGTQGNQAITESISNGQTLTPVGMSGATAITGVGDLALVLRSTSFNAINRLQLSIRYQTVPGQAAIVVSHTNHMTAVEPDQELLVTLPSGPLVAGSSYAVGSYTVEAVPNLSLVRLRFTATGLNTGSQYQVGNVLNVGGSSPLAGSYKITYTAPGVVEVLAPGIVGFPTQSFDASLYPLQSFPVANTTLAQIAAAINAYNPINPIATAQAIGVNASSYLVTNPTYITYSNASPYSGSDMPGAFDWHTFNCKRSGSAGIFQYDSSTPSLNNIKALVQTDDSIFPNTTDSAGTTYTPVGEIVMVVPTNTVTITRWMNFNAVSSLPILAAIEPHDSNNQLQISSLQDGSAGAVQITGVSANQIQSFVIGNATNDNVATKMRVLWSDAKGMVPGEVLAVSNSVTAELQRAYRTTPTGAAITPANPADTTTYFRTTTAVKYLKTGANSARLIFYRNGMGPAQNESLVAGNQVTMASLVANQLVSVTVTGGGVFSARVGDMMYIRPVGSPFAADVVNKALPDSGIFGIPAGSNLSEYWGYPVVDVIDDQHITILAPNITTFSTVTLNTATDLVFIAAVWNEKNIRSNYQEGAKFFQPFGTGVARVVVKKIGGNFLSIFLQNNTTEPADDMRLDAMSVNTDDFIVLGADFAIENQGTFRLVAHNGRNHMIVYAPNGGVDELVDTTSFENGGIGSRKWGVGEFTTPRTIRVLDSESVQVGSRLRISAALNNNQWFPAAMIGTFSITNIGYQGLDYTGFSLPHTPASGTPDPTKFVPYVDFVLPNAPTAIVDGSGNPIDTFLLGANNPSIGFVEETAMTVYRMVSGFGVNPQNPEEAELFLQPQLNTVKMSETFGSIVEALSKVGFAESTFEGIDGYKVFGGLIQQAHKIVDGSATNITLFPGVKAAGTNVEILPPLIKTIQIALTVRPKDGVSLNSIGEVVKATVAGYVNGLGVGQPVILSEIIRIVQSLPGVYSTQILTTFPAAQDDRIVVADIEKCLILDANADISVG